MNYEKKRKRQSGRQARNKPPELEYKIWVDEWDQLMATMGKVPMKSMTREEFARDYVGS